MKNTLKATMKMRASSLMPNATKDERQHGDARDDVERRGERVEQLAQRARDASSQANDQSRQRPEDEAPEQPLSRGPSIVWELAIGQLVFRALEYVPWRGIEQRINPALLAGELPQEDQGDGQD